MDRRRNIGSIEALELCRVAEDPLERSRHGVHFFGLEPQPGKPRGPFDLFTRDPGHGRGE